MSNQPTADGAVAQAPASGQEAVARPFGPTVKRRKPITNAEVERLLYLTMEGEVIKSLMGGNDAQCFTTEQFADARDEWCAKMTGSTREELGIEKAPLDCSRGQLRSCALVTEVQQDVWTLKAFANQTT